MDQWNCTCGRQVSQRVSPPDKNGVQHVECGECGAYLGPCD